MGRILITGASGNVGRYVAQYSLENGQEITAAGTHTDTLAEMFGDRAEIVYFDFTDPKTFSDALKDVDRVFIMRPPHLGKPEDLKPFIDALREKGGIRLVSFLSLIGVENNPFPPHHKIEKYIEQANLPYCHIRPGFFMQNISGVHAFEIKHFNRIVVPVKKALTSFRRGGHRRDHGKGIARAGSSSKESVFHHRRRSHRLLAGCGDFIEGIGQRDHIYESEAVPCKKILDRSQGSGAA